MNIREVLDQESAGCASCEVDATMPRFFIPKSMAARTYYVGQFGARIVRGLKRRRRAGAGAPSRASLGG